MKKINILLIIPLFCLPQFLCAIGQNSISDKYEDTLNLWLNSDIDLQQMLQELSNLEAGISEYSLSWENYYWYSRISLLRGQIYYDLKENGLSINALEDSLYFAEQANELRTMSETLSTMAMANSLLMVQKGLLFTIANFSVPVEQADMALELDSRNLHASMIKAQFLCNAPFIAGGNLEEGISMLRGLSEQDDLSPADRFIILQSLAEIYLSNNRKKDAAFTCRMALEIYPGNRNCLNMLSELGG